MARQARIEYEGAVYHVMSRGLRGDSIYKGVADRKMFLEVVEAAVEQTGWEVHAYVLMSNHYHLLLTTPGANLSRGMQWLQGTYAKRFKSRHKLIGPVFNNRFKSPVIDAGRGDYFLTVADYIHLNPARAFMLSKKNPSLENFRWSSFPACLHPKRRPDWLRCERVLEAMPGCADTPAGRRRYGRALEKRTNACLLNKEDRDVEAWGQIRRGWAYGDEPFEDEVLARVEGRMLQGARTSYTGDAARRHDEAAAKQLVESAAGRMNIDLSELAERAKSDPYKQALVWLLKTRTVMPDRWISEYLHAGSRQMIFNAVKRFKKGAETEIRKLRQMASNYE